MHQILWLENLSNEVRMAAIQLVIGWKLAIAVWVLLLQLFIGNKMNHMVILCSSRTEEEKEYRARLS